MSTTRLTSILPLAFATALLLSTVGCSGGSKTNIGSTSQADKSPDGGKKHRHNGAQGNDVDGDEDGGDDDQGEDQDDHGDD
jgi:hypothetical protein